MSNKYKIILFMRAKQTILEIHYAYVSNIACFYRCHQCEFAMNHDRCSSEFGDFARLNKRIPEDKLNGILSNKYYRNIIESIENRTYSRLMSRDYIL